MRGGIRRRLARAIGGLLGHLYPSSRTGWARAMAAEIEAVEEDGAALRFALGCLWGGCRVVAAGKLSSPGGGRPMILTLSRLREPRVAAIACALAATCLGIFYLAAAGAPLRYPVVNGAAFLLGVVALGGVSGAIAQTRRYADRLPILLGACLLATALAGAAADGASRWILVGPLGVQVSLVLLPLAIVTFARFPTFPGCAGIAVAALALALQPDRAMAGVLVLGMATLAVARPGRWSLAALAAAVAAFAAAMMRPDAPPAVPFVDQILFTAFDVHLAAGAAVLFGALLLLVPPVVGWRGDPARHLYLVLGAVWLGCIAAAVLGNYPTPVVGYGGSAILGYLLSFSSLPSAAEARRENDAAAPAESAGRIDGLGRSASPA